jgi:hypothetical protein
MVPYLHVIDSPHANAFNEEAVEISLAGIREQEIYKIIRKCIIRA